MKHFEFLIPLLVVFFLLLIFALHHHDDNKKIRKASQALNIPDRYINKLSPHLLAIFRNHEYMLRESDSQFYIKLVREQPSLYAVIQNIVDNLIELDEHRQQSNITCC